MQTELAELNERFLILLRESARTSPSEAAVRFGLEPEVLTLLSRMEWHEVRQLAACAVPLFSLQVPAGVLDMLLEHYDQTPQARLKTVLSSRLAAISVKGAGCSGKAAAAGGLR